MELISISKEDVTLDLPRDEVRLLCNSLNEVCNGMKLNDFESKIGISREEADVVHDNMRKNYLKMMQGVDEYMDEIEPVKFNIIHILSKKKWTALRNALNEICIDFGESEFQTRLGLDLSEAQIILKSFDSILKKME